jgi:hypothetical protein
MKRVKIMYNIKQDGKIKTMDIDIPEDHKGNDWSYCSEYFSKHHGKYYHLSIVDKYNCL